ncbi:T9SS type A sorting domain-containing protein [candidate division GN15 bacterium]|nr:T9SS type A sorting domain-containing protein [candidate division GN15 bacterium]
MKLASVFMAMMIVVFGFAAASAQEMELSNVTGLYGTDSILYNSSVTFDFTLNNTTGVVMEGTTNGFEIYTDNNAGYTLTVDEDKFTTVMAPLFDLGQFINYFGGGANPDTVGFAGVKLFSTGLAGGESLQPISFTVDIGGPETGATEFCVDSAWYPPGGDWLWAGADGGAYIPSWGGPFCYDLIDTSASPLNLVVDSTELGFTGTEGGANPAAKSFNISTDGDPANFTISGYDTNWITVTPNSGTTPDDINVAVDLSGLAPGTYMDTLVIESGDVVNSPQEVVITLTVEAAPVNLVVDSSSVSFTATEDGANPASKSFNIATDGDPVNFSITGFDPAWIALTPDNGTTPQDVTIDIDITGVPAGDYVDTLVIEAAGADNSPQEVIVNLTVEPAPIELVVDSTDLNFTATEGGANPAAKSFLISTDGDPVDFAITGFDPGWITVDPTTGTTDEAIAVSVDITGLPDGSYVDTLEIASANPLVTNSPQYVLISLTVLPQANNIVLTPAVLNFTAVEGGANPANQTFEVASSGDQFDFTASELSPWIEISPDAGTTPDTITVSVDITGVTVGSYSDSIMISSGDADNSPQYVYINLTVNEDTTPVITMVDPNQGTQGQSLTVTITGAYTSFGQGSETIVRFENPSTTFTASGSASSQTEVVASVNIPGDAFVGMYDVIVEEVGVGTVTATDAFEVLAGSNLVLSDDTLSFLAIENGPNPAAQDLVVGSDNDPLAYVADLTGLSWITFTPEAGTTPDTIAVGVDITGLAPNTYYATVPVSSIDALNSPQNVVIELVVDPEPVYELTIDPSILSFTTEVGVNPPAQKFAIEEISDANVDYNLTVIPSWIVPSPMSGTTPDSITVDIDVTGVPVGTYTDSILVASDAASNDPLFVVVSLEVNPIQSTTDSLWLPMNTPAYPELPFEVPIYFSNSADLAGASVVLEWDTPEFTLDSVSFEESAVAGFDTLEVMTGATRGTYVSIKAVAGSAAQYVSAVDTGKILATLHFMASADAQAQTYDLALSGDPGLIPDGFDSNPAFLLDFGQGPEPVSPVVPDSTVGIIVDDEPPSNYICGYTKDSQGEPIPGATVELWADFPCDAEGPAMTMVSDENGYFEFTDFNLVSFDIYAYYMTGSPIQPMYYPDKAEDLNYLDENIDLILADVPEWTTTNYWLNAYCGDISYFDCPVPVGSVIDAYTAGTDIHVGTFLVHSSGQYGFMPVYGSDEYGTQAAEDGDIIRFYINGTLAATTPQDPAFYDSDLPSETPWNVCLEGGLTTKYCELVEGWNLISWNLETATNDIEEVLSSIAGQYDVVLGFEQGGLTYDPDFLQFSTLWQVDHLSGYWIRINDPEGATLAITGAPVAPSTPIDLYNGWNLVSYLPEMTMATEDALASVHDNLIVALGYDGEGLVYEPGQGQFNNLTEMTTCFGYWLKVNGDQMLTYPEAIGASLIPSRPARNMPVAKAADAPGVTKTTRWVDLYSEGLQLDNETVEAGAVVTAHTTDGQKVGHFVMDDNGQFGFMPVYADEPSTVETDGVRAGGEFYLAINGVKTKETFTFTGSGEKVEVFSLTSAETGPAEVPNSYSLSQNYPNPFNPSTTIEFNMANTGHAKVDVYNMLGQHVKTLFDGQAEAGQNQVQWDGTNNGGESVASGVYFYRLSADNYIETKKMTLLK